MIKNIITEESEVYLINDSGMILEDTVMLNINDSNIKDMNWFYDIQKKINKDDLYIDTRVGIIGLARFPHISVLGRIYNANIDEMKKFIKTVYHKPYIDVTLKHISKFNAREDKFYDVLKIDIDSPDLDSLHSKLKNRFENNHLHDEYNPHITIAHVNINTCEHLLGEHPYFNKTIRFTTIDYIPGTYAGVTVSIPIK